MARSESIALREERDELRAEVARLRALLDEHTGRQSDLEAHVAELKLRIQELEERASQDGAGTAFLWEAVQLLARSMLPFAAAGAAVPLAMGVGAGAMAAEATAKLLPRRPQGLSLRPRNPTLASIVILNFDGRDLLKKNIPFCQAAIARTGKAHELIVIDNGSSDGSLELLNDSFPGVKVMSLPRNLFFSRGYDAGLNVATRDILVLLNSDMRVEPDFLEPLLEPFKTDEQVFAVASQILMAKGKRREETGLTRGRFAHGKFEFRHDAPPDDLGDAPVPILWAGGGAAAFDRRKFFEIGGLDTLYDPFYCEDADLSLRAWRRGWKVLFAPTSKVWHDHRTTTRRVFGEKFVNQTVRRNTLLLHWANLSDPELLREHLVRLPRMAFEQTRKHGLSGLNSLFGAAARAPRALARRLREREPGPSIREIFERTELGADPTSKPRPKLRSASDKLRIVMVAPYHVYPVQHGGAVRMYNVLRELARRGHEISLAGFVDNAEQLEAGKHLREFCADVKLLQRSREVDARPWTATPGGVWEFESAELRRELRLLVEKRDPDVVQIEYTHMAPYGIELPRGRHVSCLTEHDVAFVSLYRQALAQPGRALKAQSYLEYLKMFRWELEALQAFDVVFAVTSRDAELLRGYLGDGVHVSDRAPTGADTEAMANVVRAPQGESILFVGNFAHSPNVDAARWLGTEILPELWKRSPDLRVVIAGRAPPEDVRKLAEDPRVQVLGFVPDLQALYAGAGAFVSPVRVAAGVRVKLLEAFAAGVPVVSTRQGAEGIDVEHEREILLADSPAAIAEETVRVLRDRALADKLSVAGRKLASERYSWRGIVDGLEDEYRQALRRKQLERNPS